MWSKGYKKNTYHHSITLDKTKCTRCYTCIIRMEGYCISEEAGYPMEH